MYDPTQDYLDPPLQGYRLAGKRYSPVAPNSDGALASEEFGLLLKAEDEVLQFYDQATGERLLTAEERLAQEAAARRAAEAELAKLREELRRRDVSE